MMQTGQGVQRQLLAPAAYGSARRSS